MIDIYMDHHKTDTFTSADGGSPQFKLSESEPQEKAEALFLLFKPVTEW